MQPCIPPSAAAARHAPAAGSPGCALVIVRLRPPTEATLDDMRNVAERVRGLFSAMPGLCRKYFSYSAERHEVVNVYVWHDRAAAAQVLHPDFVAGIRSAYAGEPDITLTEVVAIAEPTPAAERA